MGLFSNKNKRDRAAEDSGRFYSKDDDAAIGERARAKRASHAGAGAGKNAGASARRSANDPLLPEKKRARRRLVGAIALALAAAVGLPMLLDSTPKPLAGDIAIQIPSKDKAAPLPAPATPASRDGEAAPASAPGAAPVAPPAASSHPKSVSAADSVDQGEEVIAAPPPVARPPRAEAHNEPHKPEPKPQAVADLPKLEHKEPRPEHKDAVKPDHKDSKIDARLADKAARDDKPVKPHEDKPAKPHEESRALAILEGKPADAKPEAKADAGAGPKAMVQVAAMSSEEKAAELQAKLRAAGISSSTEKSGNGLVRVKIGPYTRDEADKARAKLAKLGL
jgi:DedD protein